MQVMVQNKERRRWRKLRESNEMLSEREMIIQNEDRLKKVLCHIRKKSDVEVL